MIATKDLIEKFQYALDNHWGYIMYMTHEMWSDAKQKAYVAERKDDPDCKMSCEYGGKWAGHWVTDCSGLFKWAFTMLDGTIAHGSNSIWDKYCTSKGKLRNGERTDGQELKPGTAVFTEAEDGRHNHIGLYTGNGLVIEAQGTQAGVVTSLVTNKKWKAWGELKGVSYAEGGEKEMQKATVVLPSGASGRTVNMRESASRSAKIVCQVPVGASVDVIQDNGEWCYIQYNGKTGYMMSNYLEYEGQDGESGDYLSPEEIAEIQKALKDIENATETIGRIVGRG